MPMFSWNTFLIGSLIATHFLYLMQWALKRRDIYNVDINSIIANDMSFISLIKNELYNFRPCFSYISVMERQWTMSEMVIYRAALRSF